MSDRRRKLVLVVGFLLGVTFLWVALRKTNFREVGETLANASFWVVAPFLATLVLLYWIRAVRWSILLGPLREGIKGRDVFPAVMIGFASNIALPPPSSELVRMFIISRQLDLKNTAVLATIALERVFDFLGIVLLLGFALLIAPKPSHELVVVGYVGGAIGVVVILVAAAYARWTEPLLAALTRFFRLFPTKIERVLEADSMLVASGLIALKHKRRIASVTALTFIQWMLMSLGIYLSMLAVNIRPHPSAALVVLAFTFVGVTLPTTPGAVGTIQLSFTLALTPYGVSAGGAVAASVFWHFFAYCFVVSTGFYYFLRMGYSLGEIRRQARESEFIEVD